MGTNGIKFLSPVFHTTRDTSHLNWWQSILFWHVFRPFARLCQRLGLPVLIDKEGARLEVLSIATSEPIASAIVAATGENAFYTRHVPVDVSLPITNVVFGGERSPMSDTRGLEQAAGAREHVAIVCPYTRDLCRPHDSIPRTKLIQAARESAKLVEKLAVNL